MQGLGAITGQSLGHISKQGIISPQLSIARIKMEILLNGEARQLPEGYTIASLIEELGLIGRRLAVEVNPEIVPRSTHASHPLQPGDRIEIVHAIGGG